MVEYNHKIVVVVEESNYNENNYPGMQNYYHTLIPPIIIFTIIHIFLVFSFEFNYWVGTFVTRQASIITLSVASQTEPSTDLLPDLHQEREGRRANS